MDIYTRPKASYSPKLTRTVQAAVLITCSKQLLTWPGFFGLFVWAGVWLGSYTAQAQSCKCSQYIYLNDPTNNTNGYVHKFRVETNGLLTELPNGTTGTIPWFPSGGGLPSPHGLGQDLNGNIYIGETTGGDVRKLTCDGTLVPETGTGGFRIATGGYNFVSKDGILYLNPPGRNRIVAYRLCDGVLLGFVSLRDLPNNTNYTAGALEDWGFKIDKNGTMYVSAGYNDYDGTKNYLAYRFTPTLADFTANTIYAPLITQAAYSTVGISTNNDAWAIESDNAGNIFQIIDDYTANRTWLLKFSSTGTLLASAFDVAGGTGWSGALGMTYNPVLNVLYLAGRDDECITIVDPATLTRTGGVANPPGVTSTVSKGMRLVTECCPGTSRMSVDTVVCGAKVNDSFFLQRLIGNCDGPICGGTWTADPGNSGLTYNVCDNSVTVNSLTACGGFKLTSAGGVNSACGSFTISVKIGFANVTAPVVAGSQTICAGGNPTAFTTQTAATGTGPLTYQWQASTTNCTTGFANIGGATAATYDPPGPLNTTTYYRVITASPGSCSSQTGTCSATSNCITVTVNPVPQLIIGMATCSSQTSYALGFTATTGASLTTSLGSVSGSQVINIPNSQTALLTATLSGCSTTAITTAPSLPPAPTVLVNQPTCTSPTGTITVTNPTTGVTYSFDNGATYGTSATSGTLAPGTYQVKVKSTNGCESGATPVTITAQPATPVITVNNPTICAGTSGQLTVQGCGGSINWSTNETQATISVSPDKTQSYSVTCTANGCAATATATVTVNPKPMVAITATTCNGLTTYTVSFTATAGASLTASAGTLAGNQVSGIPSGQAVVLTATLNGCSTTATTPAPDCQANAASLGNQTFVDTNGDGLQNNGEAALADVIVTLISDGTVLATATTDANGLYSFTGLTPGTPYSVSFTTPTNYSATTYPGGTTPAISLSASENNLSLDAGFLLLPANVLLTKQVSRSRAEVGDVVSYTVTLQNTGPGSATALNVSDLYSAGVSPVPGSFSVTPGTSFSATAGGGTWTVASLPASSTVTLLYSASLTQEGIHYNTATLGNQTATACTTIPFRVCASEPFEFLLRAPTSTTHATYQWSRNGQPITGATSSTLTVTDVGEYLVTAQSEQGCLNGSCCPFVIEALPAPSLTALAVAATCTGITPQANAYLRLAGNSMNATGFNITAGSNFTAAAPLFASTQSLASITNGVLLAGLANPALATGQVYTIRVYTVDGCFTDTLVTLPQTVCPCPVGICVPFMVRKVAVR